MIVASKLGKWYQLGHRARYGRLTEAIAARSRQVLRRTPPSDPGGIWALRGVTFEVQESESVGVIGANGAGKSTLLKILSRITEPTEGFARLRGRVGSLLEVGTGFHPELTGRENVHLNAALIGMRRPQVRRLFDDIVTFAELERFIDTQVKRYSSGMQVRLAFAVAAHLEPDVLIVDEVLAVGDAAFQQKCMSRMSDAATVGRTVLFVSHNMTAIQRLCPRALLLDAGVVVRDGPSSLVTDDYLSRVRSRASQDLAERSDRLGDGRIRFRSVQFAAGDGSSLSPRCGAPLSIRIAFDAQSALSDIEVSIGIFSQSGEGVAYLGTELDASPIRAVPARGWFECRIPTLPLLPGRYTMNLYCTVRGSMADWVRDAVLLDVAPGDFYRSGKFPPTGYGSVAVRQSWKVVEGCEKTVEAT